MNDERWRQVDKIFHDVLEREPHARRPFLDRVCADDPALKKEIEDLIHSYEEAGSFLDSPASDKTIEPAGLRGSASLAGRIFGRYEMRSLLGSGGMGDVYLARDSKLKRDVAIKVLPDAFSRDSERVARFRREAEALASVNHPNIAAIYDLEALGELRCLVLELVEGETLADVLSRGPIPVDEALRLAKQIAEALEAAHEKGIVHRDLKPANIKITNEGSVKVLDFGLAKVRESEAATRAGAWNTADPMATGPGRVMGTAAYMAPEQARGKAVDKRADIWAFGCVFYQMLTGRAPFRRDTNIDTLGAILERDPDWSALPATTPSTIRRLLSRCLEKDIRRRLHDIADARIEIEETLSGTPSAAETAEVEKMHSPASLRWSVAAPALAVALLAIGVLTWKILTLPGATLAPLPSFTTIASSGESALNIAGLRSLSMVPDGRGVVYTGIDALWYRQFDQDEPKRLLNGAAPLNFVFASNRSVGYVEGTTLMTVPLNGGPRKTITSTIGGSLGATWAPGGTIIMADRDRKTGLKSISAEGGEITVLTRPDPANGELDHAWPEMLPDGHSVLFTIMAVTGGGQASRLAVLDLKTHKPPKVLEGVGGSHAHYVSSGHLLYAEGGMLLAVGFDLAELKTLGKPSVVLDRIVTKREFGADFDVAADGTLVYVDAEQGTTPRERNLAGGRNLVWLNRKGVEESLGAPSGPYVDPRVSPDGRQVAVVVAGPGGGNTIRIWDLSLRRFTAELKAADANMRGPIWLDRNNLAYFAPGTVSGSMIFRQNINGGGEAQPLGSGVPYSVTPDGKVLLFSPQARDVAQFPLDNTDQVQTLLQTPSNESDAIVSPDSRWLAYQSDMNGEGRQEILIARYFGGSIGQGHIVSSGGGKKPFWSPNRVDLELFYLAPNNSIKAIHVGPDGTRVGDATTIVEAGAPYSVSTVGSLRDFDVSSDGQRFLMIKKSPGDLGPPPQINVRQNWLEELKRLVPVKR